MRTVTPSFKKFGASLAAAAVLTAVPVSTVMVATAQSTGSLLPDENTRSDLTVHFIDGDYTELPATGQELGDEVGPHYTGGVHTVGLRKINDVDLSTPAGWAAALDETVESTLNPSRWTPAGEVSVGADGIASFTDLELGLYLVMPFSVEDATAVNPFLVFLPATSVDADGNPTGWNTDVHAYPKASPIEVTSDITQSGNVGETTRIRHTLAMPTAMSAETVATGNAQLEFVLGSREANLEMLTDTVTVTATPTTGADIVLTDSDFEVRHEQAAPSEFEGVNNHGLWHTIVTLTQSGLAKVAEAESVSVEMDNMVVMDPELLAHEEAAPYRGLIEQTVAVTVETGHADASYGLGSRTTMSDTGALTTTVTNEFSGAPVAGAQFQIFEAPDDATYAELTGGAHGAPQSVRGETVWTTDDNGQLVVDGLAVYDENGDRINYVAVQTGVVAGFVDMQGVYPLTDFAEAAPFHEGARVEVIASDQNRLYFEDGVVAHATLDLTNYTTAGTNTLPMTGGAGVGLLVTIGGALAAGGYALSRKNKRDETEAAVDTDASAGPA